MKVRLTPPATLTRARGIALRNGARYTYTGDVRDAEGGSTWCYRRGALRIEYDRYQIGAQGLSADARCAARGIACAGSFAQRPAAWGARRLPMGIAE